MRILCLSAGVFAQSLLGGPAIAQSAALAPTNAWQLSKTEESCSIWQNYGTGTQAVTITFTSYGPDDTLRVWLAGEALPRNTNKARVFRVQLSNDGAEGEDWPMLVINGSAGTGGLVSFYTNDGKGSWHVIRGWSLPGSFADLRAGAQLDGNFANITIDSDEMEPLTLALDDLTAAFADLDQCRDQMVRDWGHDPAHLATLASGPLPVERQALAESLRMPEEMVLNHQSMTVQLRMAVDEGGQVADCTVQAPVLAPRDQRALCRPFRNARFEPARDASGNAAAGLFRATYTYFIFD